MVGDWACGRTELEEIPIVLTFTSHSNVDWFESTGSGGIDWTHEAHHFVFSLIPGCLKAID
ncbi:hypothetical protein TMatcc_007795 [Talaromyces marneffei ATCC 18224]